MPPTERRVVKEMGLDPADFFRVLPLALGGRAFEREGDRVRIADGPRRVEITATAGSPRSIGPTVRLPVLHVEIVFSGYTEPEQGAFMTVFERYFLRAGG